MSIITFPHILAKREQSLSRWTSVVARDIQFSEASSSAEYHSLKLDDYVTVLAITEDGHVPLVRQYRPALERFTWELPGGLREAGEEPIISALRELHEETGLKPLSAAEPLAKLVPDSGRMENTLWGFYVRVKNAPEAEWKAESGLECRMLPLSELKQWIMNGTFDNALHIALIGMALMKGQVSW
jgi:ADP-ribose pyrophosphatase